MSGLWCEKCATREGPQVLFSCMLCSGSLFAGRWKDGLHSLKNSGDQRTRLQAPCSTRGRLDPKQSVCKACTRPHGTAR